MAGRRSKNIYSKTDKSEFDNAASAVVAKAQVVADDIEIDPGTAPGEIGAVGLKATGGIVREEMLPELQGTRGIKAFREMSMNDPTVGALLFAVRMLIKQVAWRVQPASNDPADQAKAEFLRQCQNDMSASWADTIDEILSMLVFGFAYHEVVFKRRNGATTDPPSRFADGRIGWRKIAPRAQDTITRWEFDSSGGTQGAFQSPPPDYAERFLPINRCLLFRTEVTKGNPEGRSILRNAYRPWYFKRQIENIEGIGIERDLAGIPVAWVPPKVLKRASAEDRQVFDTFKELVTNIRNNEQAGAIVPLAYDDKGNKIFDLTLLGTGSRRLFDTSQIITRYDQRIAITVMADFILMGMDKVGSFALSSNKTRLFSTAIGAWLDSIAEVLNRHAVPRLFALNPEFGIESLPRFEHGDIETPDLAELGQYISQLSGAGAPLFPDKALEEHLRTVAGLPTQEAVSG